MAGKGPGFMSLVAELLIWVVGLSVNLGILQEGEGCHLGALFLLLGKGHEPLSLCDMPCFIAGGRSEPGGEDTRVL